MEGEGLALEQRGAAPGAHARAPGGVLRSSTCPCRCRGWIGTGAGTGRRARQPRGRLPSLPPLLALLQACKGVATGPHRRRLPRPGGAERATRRMALEGVLGADPACARRFQLRPVAAATSQRPACHAATTQQISAPHLAAVDGWRISRPGRLLGGPVDDNLQAEQSHGLRPTALTRPSSLGRAAGAGRACAMAGLPEQGRPVRRGQWKPSAQVRMNQQHQQQHCARSEEAEGIPLSLVARRARRRTPQQWPAGARPLAQVPTAMRPRAGPRRSAPARSGQSGDARGRRSARRLTGPAARSPHASMEAGPMGEGSGLLRPRHSLTHTSAPYGRDPMGRSFTCLLWTTTQPCGGQPRAPWSALAFRSRR